MDYLTYRWTNISVDLVHQEILHAKVGKGGISGFMIERMNEWING